MSRQEHTKPVPSGLVTSDAVKRTARLPHGRRQLVVLGVVAAVFAAAVLYACFGPRFWLKPDTRQGLSPHDQQLAAAITAAKNQVAAAKTPADKANADELLGVAYLNAGQSDQATQAYTDAIAANPDAKASVLDQLGYAYAHSGQRDKAIATYKELIQLLETNPPSNVHRANVRDGSAVDQYQQYVRTLEAGGSL